MLAALTSLAALLLPSPAPPVRVPAPPGIQVPLPSPVQPAGSATAVLVEGYLDRYFATYPTEATAAGRHDHDAQLEELSPPRRIAWLAFNRAMLLRLAEVASTPGLPADDRLDLELLGRRVEREMFDYAVRHRPERDPLFWTDRLGNALLLLMLRDDRPLPERLAAAAARTREIPRLAGEARQALAGTAPREVAPELARLAASQARASAGLFRAGFLAWAKGENAAAVRARAAAAPAAAAFDDLAGFLDGLAARASGSPRLGAQYATAFRLGTGVEEPVAAVLAAAEADLPAKRAEAARYGRAVWSEVLPGETPPADDRALLARLFARIAADRARTTDELVADYRRQVTDLAAFLRAHAVVTLPEPLALEVGPSPGFLLGQSVGGVYAAGPYEPDGKTLWLLPTPADGATPAEREVFFRGFNHHFNVMITPHEIYPGHYLQLRIAAHRPHKVRALFADDTYVEGWGTFCERLLSDLGWGGPLDRLAHLKKQLENVARTVVDIRVHTQGMTREEVLAYARGEALQDEQLAMNLWTRAITSAPQLTTYYLGYREVWRLYEDVQKARGSAFSVREFVDGMMAQGPVPVARYRERMLEKLKVNK
jgi:uncharacterized protein (DUF885 family)